MFMLFGIVPVPAWAFVAGILAWDGYQSITPNKVRLPPSHILPSSRVGHDGIRGSYLTDYLI